LRQGSGGGGVPDRSPVWIGLADLLLCIVSVVIVAVAPVKAKTDGIKPHAEYLLSIEWDVNIDADADIWLVGPSGRPVFYAARDIGCATLDKDNRGFLDSVVTLLDGSQVRVDSDKETISLNCIEPGHYDLGANLYAYNVNMKNQRERTDLTLRVHVEITGLNPVRTLFSKDVTLDGVGQTINWASFDMARDGSIALVDPPLEPITTAYEKTR
jgi:hypothetical protein